MQFGIVLKIHIIKFDVVVGIVYFHLHLTTTMKGGKIIIMISFVRCFNCSEK